MLNNNNNNNKQMKKPKTKIHWSQLKELPWDEAGLV